MVKIADMSLRRLMSDDGGSRTGLTCNQFWIVGLAIVYL